MRSGAPMLSHASLIQRAAARRVLTSAPLVSLWQRTRTGAVDAAVTAAIGVDVELLVAGLGTLDDVISALVAASCEGTGTREAARGLDAGALSASDGGAGGSFSIGGDGELVYTCAPVDPSGPGEEADLSVSFAAGSASFVADASAPCEAPIGVTVSIGDNGVISDDLFEALIDGVVVLTSDGPVRDTASMRALLPGTYRLEVVGLAAPDGVGTYFVQVLGGGSTLSGPGGCSVSCTRASGSDLPAGARLEWTLMVPREDP